MLGTVLEKKKGGKGQNHFGLARNPRQENTDP